MSVPSLASPSFSAGRPTLDRAAVGSRHREHHIYNEDVVLRTSDLCASYLVTRCDMGNIEAPPLVDQLCFDLYAASWAVTAAYRRVLAALGLRYPQYMVLVVPWEHDMHHA